MYNNFWNGGGFGIVGFGVGIVFALVVLWSIVWKGLALWKSARNSHRGWFIALLVINTLGILEILYIYYFSKQIKRS